MRGTAGSDVHSITIEHRNLNLSEGTTLDRRRLPEWVEDAVTGGIPVYLRVSGITCEPRLFSLTLEYGRYKLTLEEAEAVVAF